MRLLMLLLFFAFCIAASDVQAQRCLSYEPDTVTLTGSVYAKDFPGPPNYESFRHGDERMRYWILRLPKAVCVAGRGNDQIDVSVANIREIQLVFQDESFYHKFRSLVRHRARFRVVGSLYHRHTGHHVRTILITVQSFAPART